MAAKEGETAGMSPRVHDVIIKGNARTKDRLIKAEIMDVLNSKQASTFKEVTDMTEAHLKKLGIFDFVEVYIDDGPNELPGSVNVVVEVSESKVLDWSPITFLVNFWGPRTIEGGLKLKNLLGFADIWKSTLGYGWNQTTEAKTWSLGGGMNLKDLFGKGDIWEGSLSYSSDQTTQFDIGVELPKIRCWKTPLSAKASLLTQDWLKFSSYNEQSLGLTLKLLSTRNHDLEYDLTWRTLTDPSQMAGASIRRQLGHSLLSSLKYSFKVDHMDSPIRPTKGYAFGFTALLAGLYPDSRTARFLRQEFDFRYALPLGFHNAALNCGISGGLILPWGKRSSNEPLSVADSFFMGGNASPFGPLGRLNPIWGFKCRGLGPSEPRREASGRDAIGGDLAVSAFADLSFDLPTAMLKHYGIHGHVFASAGNVSELKAKSSFSMENFLKSFRSSVGCGIVVPIKNFLRMEVNYCQVLGSSTHDEHKTGVQISLSPLR